MPLKPGKKNIGPNIKEMEKHGHPYNQARAAALHKAYGKNPKKSSSKPEKLEKKSKKG